jgi:choline monooxygenase
MTDSPETLPARWYHDPAAYEVERHAVFGRAWLWFAHESELRSPGTYVARDYAGWRLMIVRTPDGELAGFHNVCRHRAGPLVDDGTGHCPNLVCRYHGWAYAFDGSLRSARDFGTADDFDAANYGLFRIRVESWNGLVFVNLDLDARPLVDDLAEVFDAAAPFGIGEMPFTQRLEHRLACNWKTYADNYLEGYHIPLVHPALNREVDAKHYEVILGDRWCRHVAPTREGAINAGLWGFRWPNLALNVYPRGVNVEVIVPTSPTTCTVLYNYCFVDPDDPANADVVKMSCDVMAEDQWVAEAVQRNLESGVYNVGRLSPRHEQGVAQFQALVRAAHTAADPAL